MTIASCGIIYSSNSVINWCLWRKHLIKQQQYCNNDPIKQEWINFFLLTIYIYQKNVSTKLSIANLYVHDSMCNEIDQTRM